MIPSEFELKDKTVIISGAARGIGKGIVRVFAESGAKVMISRKTIFGWHNHAPQRVTHIEQLLEFSY